MILFHRCFLSDLDGFRMFVFGVVYATSGLCQIRPISWTQWTVPSPSWKCQEGPWIVLLRWNSMDCRLRWDVLHRGMDVRTQRPLPSTRDCLAVVGFVCCEPRHVLSPILFFNHIRNAGTPNMTSPIPAELWMSVWLCVVASSYLSIVT